MFGNNINCRVVDDVQADGASRPAPALEVISRQKAYARETVSGTYTGTRAEAEALIGEQLQRRYFGGTNVVVHPNQDDTGGDFSFVGYTD
jgi:hypothetical protein